MSLSALIRKRSNAPLATATPATFATQQAKTGGTVARVATVAVANHVDEQTANLSTLRGADLPEPENEHQLEAGDYLELDALILRYADLTNMPAEHLGKLQAARRRMSPALIQADIEQFMEWIANLEFLSGEIKL